MSRVDILIRSCLTVTTYIIICFQTIKSTKLQSYFLEKYAIISPLNFFLNLNVATVISRRPARAQCTVALRVSRSLLPCVLNWTRSISKLCLYRVEFRYVKIAFVFISKHCVFVFYVIVGFGNWSVKRMNKFSFSWCDSFAYKNKVYFLIFQNLYYALITLIKYPQWIECVQKIFHESISFSPVIEQHLYPLTSVHHSY